MVHSTKPVTIIVLIFLLGSVSISLYSTQQLSLTVQNGHSGFINTVDISPDGNHIASAGDDRTIKIWDVKTKKLIKTLQGHTNTVFSIKFSHDGTRIYSGGRFNYVYVWNIQTGEIVDKFYHDATVLSLDITPDNKYLVLGDMNGVLRITNLVTKKTPIRFTAHKKNIRFVKFSHDGSKLLSGARDNFVRVWDIDSQKMLYERKEFWFALRSASFSPDDERIIMSGDSVYKMWDLISDTILWEYSAENGNGDFVFNNDGTSVISSCNGVTVYDSETGTVLESVKGHDDNIPAITLSSDGKRIVTGSWDQSMMLWDTGPLRPVHTFKANQNRITAVKYSSDGKYLVTGSYDKTFKVWNAVSCNLLYSIEAHEKSIYDIAVSPDSRLIATSGSFDKLVKLWNIHNGSLIKTLKCTSEPLHAVEFSPDGSIIVCAGSEPRIIEIFEVESGELIRTIQAGEGRVWDMQFSPDGTKLATGQGTFKNDTTAKIWDVQSGNLIYTLPGHTSAITSVAFNSDGTLLASGSSDKTVRLWNATSGKFIRDFTGHGGGINGLKFSHNDRYIYTGGGSMDMNDYSIRMWDVETGKEVHKFPGHERGINSFSLHPSGDLLASGSVDGSVKIWNLTNREHVTLLAQQGEWCIYTDDGYWDASINGGDLVAMTKGLEVFSIDQFAIHNNRPDIIHSRIKPGNDDEINHYYNLYKKRLRKNGLNEQESSNELHAPETEILSTKQTGLDCLLTFKITDSKYSIKKYNIYVNDIPLFGADGKKVNTRKKVIKESIQLTDGVNKIEASCTNQKGIESYRALTSLTYRNDVAGDLYFIGFGVSQYKDTSLNLAWADKDVQDLADLFNTMTDRFAAIYINTFLNQKCTVDSIKSAKRILDNAGVSDTLVLFIAGHGVHDDDPDSTYYYLPHEADIDNLKRSAANFELIEDLLQGIAPRNKLFLMDTCESGDVDDEQQDLYYAMADKRGIKARSIQRGITVNTINEKSQKKILKRNKRPWLQSRNRYIYNDLIRRSGAIVFSSCKGGEFSYESVQAENGFFTEEIINALTDSDTDSDKDGTISIDELRSYVIKAVPEHTNGMQNPTVDRDNIYQKFGFPIVQEK